MKKKTPCIRAISNYIGHQVFTRERYKHGPLKDDSWKNLINHVGFSNTRYMLLSIGICHKGPVLKGFSHNLFSITQILYFGHYCGMCDIERFAHKDLYTRRVFDWVWVWVQMLPGTSNGSWRDLKLEHHGTLIEGPALPFEVPCCTAIQDHWGQHSDQHCQV